MREKMRIEMRQKKCRWFLGISFSVFALSALYIIWLLATMRLQLQADFPDNPYWVERQFNTAVVFAGIWLIPGLALELSFIRSVYKTLKHKPEGGVKVFYVISAILAFLALALLCIIWFGKFPDKKGVFGLYPSEILMLTGWPIFLVSFLLGSLPIKHRD